MHILLNLVFSQEIANNPSAQAFLGPEDAEVGIITTPFVPWFRSPFSKYQE